VLFVGARNVGKTAIINSIIESSPRAHSSQATDSVFELQCAHASFLFNKTSYLPFSRDAYEPQKTKHLVEEELLLSGFVRQSWMLPMELLRLIATFWLHLGVGATLMESPNHAQLAEIWEPQSDDPDEWRLLYPCVSVVVYVVDTASFDEQVAVGAQRKNKLVHSRDLFRRMDADASQTDMHLFLVFHNKDVMEAKLRSIQLSEWTSKCELFETTLPALPFEEGVANIDTNVQRAMFKIQSSFPIMRRRGFQTIEKHLTSMRDKSSIEKVWKRICA